MRAVVFLQDRVLASPDEARISLFDRGYLLGDSIFETLRTFEGVPFRLDEHLQRLEHASSVTGIALPRSRDELASIVRDVARRADAPEVNVRITVSRGESARAGLATEGCDHPVLSVIARELTPPPASRYVEGIAAVVVAARKIPAECLDPRIKTGTYLPQVLAKREVERRGAVEGLQLSIGGDVVSGISSNVFVVSGRRLLTPHAASGCREGVTRAAVLEVAAEHGFDPQERALTVDEIAGADEVFFTSTVIGCLPVASLDGRRYGAAGTFPAVTRLGAALGALMQSEARA